MGKKTQGSQTDHQTREPDAQQCHRIRDVVGRVVRGRDMIEAMSGAVPGAARAARLTLATAMTAPEVLVEPELADIGLRDFHRLDDAVRADRCAAEVVLPELRRLLAEPPQVPLRSERVLTLRFDPVCAMIVSPGRARATTTRNGATYYFCSANCRDCFDRDPDRYLGNAALAIGARRWRQDKAPGKL